MAILGNLQRRIPQLPRPLGLKLLLQSIDGSAKSFSYGSKGGLRLTHFIPKAHSFTLTAFFFFDTQCAYSVIYPIVKGDVKGDALK